MHSSFTVHHPPAAAATHTSTVPLPTSTVVNVSRPTPSTSTPTFSTTALSSSLLSASRLDQALLFAGVLTFTSAAAYAAYSYWQRASNSAANTSKAATVKPTATKRPLQSAATNAEYAAATAVEQITKPLDTAQQANTTPAATVTNLPTPLRTRLSSARGVLFDLDGTLVESAEIWYRLINGASRHFGFDEVSYDEWKATFGQSMERNVEMWMAGLDQGKFNVYCDEHYADHLEHLHILGGSIDLLTLVNGKYGKENVAIVTNWYEMTTIHTAQPPQHSIC